MRTEVTNENIAQLKHRDIVIFALFCAKQVERKVNNIEAIKCMRVTELWLDGKATVEECMHAADTGYAANNIGYTTDCDYAAVNAAYIVYTTNAVYYAAYAADTKVNKVKQEEYLYELININEIVEQQLLGV